MSDQKDKKSIITPSINTPVDYAFDRMLKSFMKQVDKTGVLQEVRARRYYIKPSELKRLSKKGKRN